MDRLAKPMGFEADGRREERNEAPDWNPGQFLFSLGIAILFFGFISGCIRFWSQGGIELLPAFRYAVLLSIPFLASGLLRGGFVFGPSILYRLLHPGAFVFVLVLSFFTDMLCKEFNLLQGPSVRGVIIVCAALSYLLIRERFTLFLNIAALLAPLMLMAAFLGEANGRMLFSDDHPSMVFRLQMLKENFPFIPFYNPTWNAGFDNRDFFATGVLNVFLLFSPVIYLFKVSSSYNIIVGMLVFFIVPLAAYLAAKIEELEDPIPVLAALLALCSSLLWYRWCLKYGAIGFIASASLLPLNVVLAAKILSASRQLTLREAMLFVVSATLMLFWSLSGVMFVPVIVLALIMFRRVIKKRYVRGIVLALLAVNIPWILLFLSASSVGKFLTLQKPALSARDQAGRSEIVSNEHNPHEVSHRSMKGGVKKISVENLVKSVREFAVKVNPLVLFLALPGVFMLRRFSTRAVYLLLGAWFLLLGTVGASLKPQLELDRMLVVLVLLSSIPVAHIFAWAIRGGAVFSSAVICGYLFAALFSVSGVVYNRSQEQYVFESDLFRNLGSAIKEHGGEGRVVFSGFILHDLGGGHIAPLSISSGKPIVASTPFHSVWWYTDVIPSSFKKRGFEGIEEFLDLQNATAVVSREKKWRNYFDQHPEKYEAVFRGKGFSLYKRKYRSSYFLEGSGELLEQGSNSVKLRVNETSALIKFNYFPFLQSSSCKIAPKALSESIKFIKLENCSPGSIVTIKAKGPLGRLFAAVDEDGTGV